MDNITHSLFGALLGQTGLKRKTGLAMPALIIGANLPDVDAACFFWLEGAEHLGFRRGITHGPIAWFLLPLVLAWLLQAFDNWQIRRGTRPKSRLPVNFKWLYLLSLIGCLSHPALDWLNVYGVRLLEPFSSRWFYGDTLFIIDVWLWLLLGFGVWNSWLHEKDNTNWQRAGRIWMYLSLLYIGFNFLISSATAYGGNADRRPDQVISSPVLFKFWEREVLWREGRVWWFAQHDFFNFTRETKSAVRSICSRDAIERAARNSSEGSAFMLWSRAPIAERAPNGTTVIRDARFYEPITARERFEVYLPELQCVDLGEEPRIR